jgi:SAM-dependent methyltransferase
MHPSARVTTHLLYYRRTRFPNRVLDLGCGDGARAIALAGHTFNRVTGLDATKGLIDLARQRAVKRQVSIDFICGDPWATPFESGQFDEVMLLGDLFGHSASMQSDVELLLEASRVLGRSGRLHLKFSDGDWMRRHFCPDSVESLPAGFIHRHRSLSPDGHCIRTDILSSGDEYGAVRHTVMTEWLYTPREVTGLLCRLGFDAVTYDNASKEGRSWLTPMEIPRFVVHCRASRSRPVLRLLPGG